MNLSYIGTLTVSCRPQIFAMLAPSPNNCGLRVERNQGVWCFVIHDRQDFLPSDSGYLSCFALCCRIAFCNCCLEHIFQEAFYLLLVSQHSAFLCVNRHSLLLPHTPSAPDLLVSEGDAVVRARGKNETGCSFSYTGCPYRLFRSRFAWVRLESGDRLSGLGSVLALIGDQPHRRGFAPRPKAGAFLGAIRCRVTRACAMSQRLKSGAPGFPRSRDDLRLPESCVQFRKTSTASLRKLFHDFPHAILLHNSAGPLQRLSLLRPVYALFLCVALVAITLPRPALCCSTWTHSRLALVICHGFTGNIVTPAMAYESLESASLTVSLVFLGLTFAILQAMAME